MASNAPAQAAGGSSADRPATTSIGRMRRMVRAIADADGSMIEATARDLGESRPILAPVAWAAGTIVLLLRGVKLLLLNWRLSLIQVVPAFWIWLAMWDLKRHSLRGVPFRHLTIGGIALAFALTIALSIAAFWCNTVFAFAIESPGQPRIRPAIRQTRPYYRRILLAGLVVGVCLGFAAVVVPRLRGVWLFVLALGAVYAIMLISFVAVPAHIIGAQKQRLPPKEAIGRMAAGGALSAVAMSPGFILDRLGLIMLGVPGLHILGFVVLAIGTALYAAGMSSVKAVKMTMKFSPTD
jgi:hypothetical protein